MKTVRIIFLLFLAGLCKIVPAQAIYSEDQKITHLIQYVKGLDAVFIRNGSEHTAPQAASHLQMKRERAGSRIKTAEDFIVKLASKSSMSGDPYMIRFRNGKEFACEMVLRLELKKLVEGKVTLLTS
jgi:hypothetical protein